MKVSGLSIGILLRQFSFKLGAKLEGNCLQKLMGETHQLHLPAIQEVLGHNKLKTTIIYSGFLKWEAVVARALWTICRLEGKVSKKESIHAQNHFMQ